MIALMRMELWLTFWVALVLALAFGVPVLELNEAGVLGLVQDPKVTRALARLAIALPFGLALYQFGLQKLRGTTGVLLHRGVPRARLFAGKAVLAGVFGSLVLYGLVELEYRITVDNQGERTLFGEARWVVSQLLALGATAWSVGALVAVGARASVASLALRALVGFAAVLGAHHWVGLGAALLPAPLGWGAYVTALLAAAWLVGRAALARYGRGERPHPQPEVHVALRGVAVALLLFPWFDELRTQTGRLADRAMARVLPELWLAGETRTVALSEQVDRTLERLVTLDGEVLLPTYQGRPPGYQDMVRARWAAEGRAQPPESSGFPPIDDVRLLALAADIAMEPVESADAAWIQALEASGHATAELSARTGTVRLVTHQPATPTGPSVTLERVARRTDGQPLSARTRIVDFVGEDLLLDEADQTLWWLDASRGEGALRAVTPPGGGVTGFEQLFSVADWTSRGARRVIGQVAVTNAGEYLRREGAWERHAPGTTGAGFALERDLDPHDVLPHLFLAEAPLGQDVAELRDGHGVLHTFELRPLKRHASAARNVVIASELARPPLQRVTDLLRADTRARLAALPWWLHAAHLVTALAAAAWCRRRARDHRGRRLFALAGFAGGPLALGALHVLRGELDAAEAAGAPSTSGASGATSSAGGSIRTEATPAPVFIDAEAEARRAA